MYTACISFELFQIYGIILDRLREDVSEVTDLKVAAHYGQGEDSHRLMPSLAATVVTKQGDSASLSVDSAIIMEWLRAGVVARGYEEAKFCTELILSGEKVHQSDSVFCNLEMTFHYSLG